MNQRKHPVTTGRKGDGEEMKKTIWLHRDALSVKCIVCSLPYESRVYVYNNGHATCAKCYLLLNRKCWGYEEPIGDIQNRSFAKMLAELNSFCKFRKYGYGEVIKYIVKRHHEETCPCAPFCCPLGGCSYRGMLLYKHVLDDCKDTTAIIAYLQATTVTPRKGQPFLVLLQPRLGSVFLLLNGDGVLEGRSLSLVYLGPPPEGNVVINYEMEVRSSIPYGDIFSLAAPASCICLLNGYEAKMFLFMPDDV